jgi:hypothetical protein
MADPVLQPPLLRTKSSRSLEGPKEARGDEARSRGRARRQPGHVPRQVDVRSRGQAAEAASRRVERGAQSR